MTKKQKIWLGIFLVMAIVPEILWGPVFGFFKFNENFRLSNDNHLVLTFITFVQFVGLIVSGILITKYAKFFWKNIVGIVLIAMSLWVFFVFYLLFATLHMGA